MSRSPMAAPRADLTESTPATAADVRVPYPELRDFAARVFARHGLPDDRARLAAEALVYGDLTGMSSHGLTNLSRLYLPLLESDRADPGAEPQVLADRGAAMLLDARRGLGLWVAADAMRRAVERAAEYGIGLVSVRGGTHFGCAGFHAALAAEHDMIGVVAANCGRQRIARPPGGRVPMLGTNPLAVAAPGGEHPPFVLDMSTTVVPTGRVRQAARAGQPVPPGWLVDDTGAPVVDPTAFDRGQAHLQWLGGRPETGMYKGYGLGLMVEILAALVPGAGLGTVAAAEDGRAGGADDDIGFLALAIAPATLRPGTGFLSDAQALFGAILDCPPIEPDGQVSYPGWHEAQRGQRYRRTGVPLTAALYRDLCEVADRYGAEPPRPCRDETPAAATAPGVADG